MPGFPRVAALLPVVVGALVAVAPITYAQSDLRLAALTVPAAKLPAGCRLKPFPAPGSEAPRVVMFPTLFENPWVGTRGLTLAVIRRMVDGGQLASERLIGPAESTRLAADVVEGYRAVYLAEDDSEINVAALVFTDPKFTSTAMMNSLLRGQPARIIAGPVVAYIYTGAGTSCGRTVGGHIEAELAPKQGP